MKTFETVLDFILPVLVHFAVWGVLIALVWNAAVLVYFYLIRPDLRPRE